MHRILVLHGPNLNALGSREPEIYGRVSLDEINRRLQQLGRELGCEVDWVETSHEGLLVDELYRARSRANGVLLNAGGLTHTSVSLRDAVRSAGVPVVEVHLSNPGGREPYRRLSLVAEAALGVVQGFGAASYELALRGLAGHLSREATP